MREPTYFLLVALVDGPLHGYGIAQRAKELSDGRVTLTAGTLYGALDRLVEAAQLVVDREEVVDGRKRRYYRITDTGLHLMSEEAERMRAAAAVGQRVIAARPAGELGLQP